MGRILSNDDDDTKCILGQIQKARGRWNGIAKILKREGANATCMARFYLAVIQALLLYGSESWVISKRNMDRLNSFHKRAVRHMTGQHIQKLGNNNWEYPDHDRLLKQCKLLPINVYIERRRGTLWNYLLQHRKDLMNEAKLSIRHCKDVNKILWWEQEYIKKEDMKSRTSEFFLN